ncbi:heme oxygenase (biliverdin-producing) [Mycobacterium sp. pV006]
MGRHPVADATRSLSTAVNVGSAVEHEAAENSPFFVELLSGRVNRRGYADYLLRLRGVYEALEATMRAHRRDPLVAAVFDPALERLSALDKDLDYWTDGGRGVLNSPALQRYQDRLQQLRWGGAIVAHHYTRYLGDLSGGQAMATLLDREYGLDGSGLAFYDFGLRVKPYKDAYRAALDRLDLDSVDIDRVVEEVKLAYHLNQALLDELSTDLASYRR